MKMWWRSKPWRWNYLAIYKLARREDYGRLAAVVVALRFPHVHQEELER